MAVNAFRIFGDAEGRSSFLRVAPTYVDAKSLAASTAETVTVPANAKFVVFSGNAPYYVNPHGATAAVPGDVSNGSASELNPAGYELRGMATFSVISPSACILTMAFYS